MAKGLSGVFPHIGGWLEERRIRRELRDREALFWKHLRRRVDNVFKDRTTWWFWKRGMMLSLESYVNHVIKEIDRAHEWANNPASPPWGYPTRRVENLGGPHQMLREDVARLGAQLEKMIAAQHPDLALQEHEAAQVQLILDAINRDTIEEGALSLSDMLAQGVPLETAARRIMVNKVVLREFFEHYYDGRDDYAPGDREYELFRWCMELPRFLKENDVKAVFGVSGSGRTFLLLVHFTLVEFRRRHIRGFERFDVECLMLPHQAHFQSRRAETNMAHVVRCLRKHNDQCVMVLDDFLFRGTTHDVVLEYFEKLIEGSKGAIHLRQIVFYAYHSRDDYEPNVLERTGKMSCGTDVYYAQFGRGDNFHDIGNHGRISNQLYDHAVYGRDIDPHADYAKLDIVAKRTREALKFIAELAGEAMAYQQAQESGELRKAA